MSVEERDAQALQDFRRGLDQLSDQEDGVANNSVTQVLLRGMSDGDCLRFVRARKYDVQKALLMADKWSKVQALMSLSSPSSSLFLLVFSSLSSSLFFLLLSVVCNLFRGKASPIRHAGLSLQHCRRALSHGARAQPTLPSQLLRHGQRR